MTWKKKSAFGPSFHRILRIRSTRGGVKTMGLDERDRSLRYRDLGVPSWESTSVDISDDRTSRLET